MNGYEDLDLDYAIPEDIDSRIPDYFYMAMAGEIFSIFGIDAFALIDPAHEYVNFEYDTGTGGWVAAFKATCDKLGLPWLAKYWDDLSWEQSDAFGDIIAQRIKGHIKKNENNHSNEYYKYLVSKEPNHDPITEDSVYA